MVYFEGKSYVFFKEEVKHDSQEKTIHFEMIEVNAGKSEAGFVAITLPSGFDVRKELVVKGAYSLLAKMKNSEEEGGHAH